MEYCIFGDVLLFCSCLKGLELDLLSIFVGYSG